VRLSLTRRSEYGIRALMHMAELPAEQRVTAAELAEACNIPPGNVPTIMNILSRAGLLVCTPGRGGGCTLALHPKNISMLDIIESLEGRLDLSHCLLDSRRCDEHDPECAVHVAWTEGRSAAVESLARTSLDETVRRQREIDGLPADTPSTRTA
jgi:Rrf2 family protein